MTLRPRRALSISAWVLVAAAPFAAFSQQSAEQELAALRAAPEMQASLFASEPLITNPAAIDIDTQGRVWVAEIQWYRAAAKDPPADKIKVLEDTDGDGKADKATVFADGLFAPMSICVAGSKVYVATSPDLWVYEDANGDLVADGPPTRLLTGFGGFNHDHGAHSLVLGPDHKWWMSHGDTGFNVTGVDGSHIEFQWGAMLRGELDGSQLEQIAVNFRNPYEIAVSSFGEAFVSDNDNDGNFSVRICWILEGGDYGWFGGPPFAMAELDGRVPPGTPFREHWHFRGFTPGFVPGTLVTGFGSPCGMCFYEGDAFGQKYKNVPLHCDAGPREVRAYRHEPQGYGMRATNEVILTSDDAYFRPDDICAAPDGSLYVADWYDGGVGGHAYNNPDQGRIFRLTPPGGTTQPVGKPGPYSNTADAIEGLKSPNLATQFLARERLLADGRRAVKSLMDLARSSEPNHRARALWVLDRIGGPARDQVAAELTRNDSAFRALAVRILRRHGDDFASPILELVGDPSPLVRREVVLAIGGIKGPAADEALTKLAATFDGTDRYQLEAIHIAARERKPQLFSALTNGGEIKAERLPLLQLLDPDETTRHLQGALAAAGLSDDDRSRILMSLGGIASEDAGGAVLGLLADANAPLPLRRLALNLAAANLAGPWKSLATDSRLPSALRELLADPESRSAALDLAADQGLTALAGDALSIANDGSVESGVRAKAVTVALRLDASGAREALEALLRDSAEPVRDAALTGLIDVQEWPTLRRIVSGEGGADDLRVAAVEKLIASTDGAIVLLRWLESDDLPPDLRERIVARAVSHPDLNVRILYERFIPEDQRPQRLGEAIGLDEILAMQGDAARGAGIFFQSTAAQCKTCHRVNGFGQTLGPDLSQIGRKYERAALLETILEPSKAIAPEYIPYLVETTGGLVHAGFLIERNDDGVVLKNAQGRLVAVATDEIVALAPQEKSLMPELVLRDVSAQDAADLLAYLESLNKSVADVTVYRVLGPFNSPDDQGLDRDFGPESSLDTPDLTAVHNDGDVEHRWQVVPAENLDGFFGIDQVKYSARKGLPREHATTYFLVYADSGADQQATLQLGSDDSSLVWLNGEEVHRFVGSRALAAGQDQVPLQLRSGRNALVVKVENYSGPGGVALSITSPSAIQLKID